MKRPSGWRTDSLWDGWTYLLPERHFLPEHGEARSHLEPQGPSGQEASTGACLLKGGSRSSELGRPNAAPAGPRGWPSPEPSPRKGPDGRAILRAQGADVGLGVHRVLCACRGLLGVCVEWAVLPGRGWRARQSTCDLPPGPGSCAALPGLWPLTSSLGTCLSGWGGSEGDSTTDTLGSELGAGAGR